MPAGRKPGVRRTLKAKDTTLTGKGNSRTVGRRAASARGPDYSDEFRALHDENRQLQDGIINLRRDVLEIREKVGATDRQTMG